MDMSQLKRYVALEAEKKTLEAKTKEITQKLATLETLIIPQMVADGMQAVTVDGRHVSIVKSIFAGPVDGDKDGVIDALKSVDETACFVAEAYSPQKLQAYVREIAHDVEAACKQDERLFDLDAVRAALAPQLARAIKVSFVHKLRSNKA
jgi:hypothetical protein